MFEESFRHTFILLFTNYAEWLFTTYSKLANSKIEFLLALHKQKSNYPLSIKYHSIIHRASDLLYHILKNILEPPKIGSMNKN